MSFNDCSALKEKESAHSITIEHVSPDHAGPPGRAFPLKANLDSRIERRTPVGGSEAPRADFDQFGLDGRRDGIVERQFQPASMCRTGSLSSLRDELGRHIRYLAMETARSVTNPYALILRCKVRFEIPSLTAAVC